MEGGWTFDTGKLLRDGGLSTNTKLGIPHHT